MHHEATRHCVERRRSNAEVLTQQDFPTYYKVMIAKRVNQSVL
jgi:hypothetical protein